MTDLNPYATNTIEHNPRNRKRKYLVWYVIAGVFFVGIGLKAGAWPVANFFTGGYIVDSRPSEWHLLWWWIAENAQMIGIGMMATSAIASLFRFVFVLTRELLELRPR